MSDTIYTFERTDWGCWSFVLVFMVLSFLAKLWGIDWP